jgi:hypothetical protein
MARQAGKRGALPNDPSRARVNLGNSIRGTAPSQAHFGHMSSIGMLGNDVWGDCVYAGNGHLAEANTYFGQGREVVVTEAQALTAYAWSGFDISAGPAGANPTDNGDTLQHGLEYLLQSANAYGVEFVAFGELDVKNTNQWQQALAWLGPLMLGVGVGTAEEEAFNTGATWDVSPGSQRIAEDHCVILTGYQPGMYWCWTWGGLQAMTPAWFAQNAWEVWGAVSRTWVNLVSGKDNQGVDLQVFGQQFSQVTGKPNPF